MFHSKFKTYRKAILLVSCIWLIVSACKKDNDEIKEEFPELETCKEVKPSSGLTSSEGGLFVYKSTEGAVIQIKRKSMEALLITLSYEPYENFSYEFWGDADPGNLSPASHENLNGKHIKDRFGVNRTVIFPDGTKMTYVSTAPWYMGGITAITIYDGDIVQHLNMTCFKLEYSSSNAAFAKHQDAIQADGETSTFEITETGLNFYNIYNEDTPGNKVYKRIELGVLYKNDKTRVDDLFDDERLIHT